MGEFYDLGWKCHNCKASGSISVLKNDSVARVEYEIKIAHALRNPNCQKPMTNRDTHDYENRFSVSSCTMTVKFIYNEGKLTQLSLWPTDEVGKKELTVLVGTLGNKKAFEGMIDDVRVNETKAILLSVTPAINYVYSYLDLIVVPKEKVKFL